VEKTLVVCDFFAQSRSFNGPFFRTGMRQRGCDLWQNASNEAKVQQQHLPLWMNKSSTGPE